MEDRRPGDATPGDVEELYDRYLDACHSGEAEEPDTFFDRHPEIDTRARERIRTLHRVISDASDQEIPFERLGEYRLLRRLGGGGMGTVYLAEQESLRRVVALKVIRPELQASGTALKRFEREALAIAKLRHGNVVTIHELGSEGDVRFIAMELVPGRPLRDLLAVERPHVARVLAWVHRIALALHAAHEEGIVHRDVKPANILITPDDRPVLLDFGMAHLTEVEATTLTRSFAGSPSYAAPEQLTGAAVDGRTDVYALGVTLYECLTGKLPFEGGTLETIFRQILVEDPPPPRRLNPDVGRAVEVVTLKAMEKRPEDRYVSAAAFASDLDALLKAEPIHARPPSLARRLRRGARRHPAKAAAVVTLFVALAAVAGLFLYRGWQEREERREEARRTVTMAGARVDEYRESREEMHALETRYQTFIDRQGDSFLTDEQDAEFEELTNRREALRRTREATFIEVLDLLRKAARLDPDVAGVDAVRARLYLQKMEEATLARDFINADLYRELVERHDPDGSVTGGLRRAGRLILSTTPRGAEVHLFRFMELAKLVEGGERRLVPVPVGADPDALPLGAWALRVVRGAGGIDAGDLILKVEGKPVRSLERPEAPAGATARVYSGGAWREVELPDGLEVRTTAAPLFVMRECVVGKTPIEESSLEPGPYQLLLRLDGHEDALFSFELAPGGTGNFTLPLNPRGSTPDGFVYVGLGRARGETYWIQEREVTCAEYLEFLNDPRTLKEIDDTGPPLIRVPRGVGEPWPRGEDGRYSIDPSWHPDWPALGVSFEDAQAYARWLSEKDGRTYALPSRNEWARAANGDMRRAYTWGNAWRPKWLKSCFARPVALPEPVMRYPIDQSCYGVYDLCGSAAEWLDDWFDEARGIRRLGGSSWGMTDPEQFDIWGGLQAFPGDANHNYGFRLVFRRRQ